MEVGSIQSQYNEVYLACAARDKEIDSLLSRIVDGTVVLGSDDVDNSKKFDAIVAVEYLFVRLRVLVENECINVKKVLNGSELPVVLRNFFQKRAVYLSEVSTRISTIRDDIQLVQRIQYLQSNEYI